MSGKFALIIGNTEYIDPGLAQLTAPGRDAEDFARILKDQDICAFDDVNILLNQPEYIVRGTIDEFFDQKKPDDLLVLYFSGHGVRDELGALYLAVKNTNRFRLRSTALKSDFIREAMDQSRSKRQVLILDCCNSGAFSQGTKAATGVSIGTATAFEAGYGRIILTASDSTQFAWEGNQVIGETDNSLFTHYLVEGLEGEADLDGDGRITVDELYDYAYEKVKFATPKQTPSKFSSKQQGEIVLRQFTRMEDIKPVALPDDLISEIEDLRPSVREWAVQRLEKILKGKNIGMVRSARKELERIEKEDDSFRVRQATTQVMEFIRQAEKAEEERKTREEAERIASQQAEEERIALEKADVERKAKQEAERLLAEQKAEEERQAKKEAKRLAALKAKEIRKAREEAERIAIRKAQQERLAREKAEAERKAKDEADKLQHAQAESEAADKAAEEKVEKEAAEREALELAARKRAEREGQEKVPVGESKPVKNLGGAYMTLALAGVGIAFILCLFASQNYLSGIFRGSPTTAVPLSTRQPSTILPTSTPRPLASSPTSTPELPPLLAKQREWVGTSLLVYSSWHEDPAPTPGYASAEYMAIYISEDGSRSADDKRISDLGNNADPVWSPDGEKIAYIHYPNQITFIKPNGDLIRTTQGDFIPNGGLAGDGLTWSPDGSMLAFSNWQDQAVAVLDVESEAVRIVVNKAGAQISWSPDGSKLAFMVREGNNFDDADGWVVYIVNVDGTNLTQVTETSDLRGEFGPFHWTPDGEYLTYVSFSLDNQGNRGNYEVWVVPANGQNQQLLNETLEVIDQRYYPWFRLRSPTDIFNTH